MENKYRKDFPLFAYRMENGQPLVYLDSAATSQKPLSVIKAVEEYYKHSAANPHGGAYALSADATALYEKARAATAAFVGGVSPEEIVFTAGTTESINRVALSYGPTVIGEGDEILITIAEHHSNLLPWQRLAREQKAVLRYVYTNSAGLIPLKAWQEKLNPRTKIVALGHVSNVLGKITPVEEVIRLAHQKGAVVLLDAAQSVAHMPVDINKLDADFLVFSGHKMLGPARIGVLYAKKQLLDTMPPLMLGGGMVEHVEEQSAVYMPPPWNMEAGTPNVEGAVGLHAAMEYYHQAGWSDIQQQERQLAQYTYNKLLEVKGLTLYGCGDPDDKAGIFSFNIDGVHPHDAASVLNSSGVAIRTGHHCAQPLMKYMGINATCRASLSFYNTTADIDTFVESLSKVRKVLGHES